MIAHKVETTHVLFNNNYQGQRARSDQHLGSGVESLIYDRYIASASVERSAIGRPPGGRIGARAISRRDLDHAMRGRKNHEEDTSVSRCWSCRRYSRRRTWNH